MKMYYEDRKESSNLLLKLTDVILKKLHIFYKSQIKYYIKNIKKLPRKEHLSQYYLLVNL